jgi:rubrerythrin
MFYTATALLYHKDLAFKKHSAVIAGFGQHFAATAEMDRRFHAGLIRAFDLRQKADYELAARLTYGEAEEQVTLARRFIQAAREYLAAHQSSVGTGEEDRHMDDVLDILELGVDKERMRKAAYEEAAAKTHNVLAKLTFASLAKQEEAHERYLQAYYDKQVAQEGWPPPAEIGVADDMMDVVKAIFKQATAQIKEAGEKDEGLTEVYEAGIAAESESIEFYTDALSKATDPNARAFFETLVKAEQLHLKLLSDTQEFLDDTEKWFFDEENWIVEG